MPDLLYCLGVAVLLAVESSFRLLSPVAFFKVKTKHTETGHIGARAAWQAVWAIPTPEHSLCRTEPVIGFSYHAFNLDIDSQDR